MGVDQSGGLVPCETRRQTVPAREDKPPYYEYHRYTVTYLP